MHPNSRLRSVDPALDPDLDLIRVGVRLRKSATLPEDAFHPIVLAQEHPITKLLIYYLLISLNCTFNWLNHILNSFSTPFSLYITNGAFPLRSSTSIEWLHASVLPQTTPFQRCANVHCTRAECLSSARGNIQTPRKTRCRDSAPSRQQEWLPKSLFSGTKERQLTPPNLGPETTESHAFKAFVQNDYAETNPLTYQTGRLVYLCEFKECLFSHSGSPSPQVFPEVFIRGDPPVSLSLAPRMFTICLDAALSPPKQSRMRILYYLHDWLVLAQSKSVLISHKLRLLTHLQRLGLTVNLQKSMLVPSQNFSFLGVELNSINKN